ncbi:MAG TPA: MBL fold metallo-hydrolase [Cyclobacteriaceae bacterium]|jgi:glyoxylase-like metal-dependent hydrolase (beta-lactamase superfamily II)|nr:MBL fold metallo-hydrolase [Cyclobacteriaceae bacterium]
MQLHVINTGLFKLDGGAMFGVVPKSIWQKTNPADDNNMCTWAMRCLLIEDRGRLILIDNGIGTKQDARFFQHYFLHGNNSLTKSLNQLGFSESDVTDMFLSHLHFDHCGGGVKKEGEKLSLTFSNAKYWSNADHWKWATQPNAREKASFLKENILPMQESGHLNFIDINRPSPFSQFDIFYASGHTDKMMIPKIRYKDKVVCFVADLLPSTGHIPLPYVMGYDTRPLITLDEKEKFLKEAAVNNYVLFLEHDSANECCTVKEVDGRVKLDRTFSLSEIL